MQAHDRATIQRMTAPVMQVHCTELHAQWTIASSRMHDDRVNADATICTHAASRLHAMQQAACMPIECTNARCKPIASRQRVQCIRRQRVHDPGRVTYGPIPYGQGPPSQDSGSEVITIAHHTHLRVNTLGCTICNITPGRPLSSQSQSSSRSVPSNVPSE